MKRCVFTLPLLLASLLCATFPAHAQRVFESTALRGQLQVKAPPDVLLNGKPARLAPGARIRNTQNLLQLSGELQGRDLVVNYTLDGAGEVRDVWILTKEEAARQPWPRTPAEAQAWVFDPTLQRWSKP